MRQSAAVAGGRRGRVRGIKALAIIIFMAFAGAWWMHVTTAAARALNGRVVPAVAGRHHRRRGAGEPDVDQPEPSLTKAPDATKTRPTTEQHRELIRTSPPPSLTAPPPAPTDPAERVLREDDAAHPLATTEASSSKPSAQGEAWRELVGVTAAPIFDEGDGSKALTPSGLLLPNSTYPYDATRNLTRRLSFKNNGSIAMEEVMLDGGEARRSVALGSIFVSIAAYRDEQCLPTLVDMFDKARWPQQVFAGVVDQRVMGRGVRAPNAMVGNVPDEPCVDYERDCLEGRPLAESVLCRFISNVRVMHVPNNLAKGPTFGRYAANMLRRNETFFMMMDSHNRFTRYWDARARNQLVMLYKRNVSKPVLSHYPDSWRNPADSDEEAQRPTRRAGDTRAPPRSLAPLEQRRMTAYLCKAKFLQTGIPRLDGVMVPILPDRRARPQPWAAAGFIFASSKMVNEVPFDPYLDYLFDGEEILYSIRLWTHGWNAYSPGENIIFHYYYRRKSKRVFSDSKTWTKPQLRSIHRVQHILKLHPLRPDLNSHARVVGVGPPPSNSRVYAALDKYGLGTKRSLSDYWKFAGGDPETRVFRKDFCKLFRTG